jgi:energy-coupling factor transport system permease protein
MFSSVDDLTTFTPGSGFFYKLNFRIKLLWIIITIFTSIIAIDMVFTTYLLICTIIILYLGGSPVFFKIKRNKALVTFVFSFIFITFIFSFINRALITSNLTDAVMFYFIARAIALGNIALLMSLLFITLLQTTKTIEMTANRGPTTSILTFLSFRSIPLVIFHLNNVIDSQRARGLEMEKMGIRSLFRSVKAIFIPLLILLTGSIDRTSKALEARGINPRIKNKTSFIKPKWNKRDFIITVYLFCQLIIAFILAILFNIHYAETTFTYYVFSEILGWL